MLIIFNNYKIAIQKFSVCYFLTNMIHLIYTEKLR